MIAQQIEIYKEEVGKANQDMPEVLPMMRELYVAEDLETARRNLEAEIWRGDRERDTLTRILASARVELGERIEEVDRDRRQVAKDLASTRTLLAERIRRVDWDQRLGCGSRGCDRWRAAVGTLPAKSGDCLPLLLQCQRPNSRSG